MHFKLDHVLYVKNRLNELSCAQKELEEAGQRYVQENAGTEPEVVVLLDNAPRIAAKQALIEKGTRQPQQELAEGVIEGL